MAFALPVANSSMRWKLVTRRRQTPWALSILTVIRWGLEASVGVMKETTGRTTHREDHSPHGWTKWWRKLGLGMHNWPRVAIVRAVQTTHISDPLGQTNWTRTIRRPIWLLRRSAVGPYFLKPISADRVRVSSSNTRATRLDRHINGFKGLKLVTLSSYSHSLLSVSRSLLPVTDLARHRFCLSVVDLCLSIVDLCSSSSIFALRPQCPSSSSPPSLRFRRSISSLRFVYLWICGFVDLFFGFLFFGFVDVLWVFVLWICGYVLWVVDLLILFFRIQTCIWSLYFDRNQSRPPPTRARSDSTRGFSRSVVGLELLHPIWLSWLRVGHKPDPDLPVDSPNDSHGKEPNLAFLDEEIQKSQLKIAALLIWIIRPKIESLLGDGYGKWFSYRKLACSNGRWLIKYRKECFTWHYLTHGH